MCFVDKTTLFTQWHHPHAYTFVACFLPEIGWQLSAWVLLTFTLYHLRHGHRSLNQIGAVHQVTLLLFSSFLWLAGRGKTTRVT